MDECANKIVDRGEVEDPDRRRIDRVSKFNVFGRGKYLNLLYRTYKWYLAGIRNVQDMSLS